MADPDTLEDVGVTMIGHGAVSVLFRPADGGIGTHMRVASKPKPSCLTQNTPSTAPEHTPHPAQPPPHEDGNRLAAHDPPEAAAAPPAHHALAPSAANAPDAPEPAGTQARTDVDQPDAPDPAGTHAPIDVDQVDIHSPALAAMDVEHSDAYGSDPHTSDDGTGARTPSDFGDFAADGMLFVRSSQVQLVPMDGAPGYFRMLDPRALGLLQGGSDGASNSSRDDDPSSPAQQSPRDNSKAA
ncbi:hypothetical protein FA95DRAFT_1613030 [Auriscalpium vulgare]|uniref:Uncharacterized protein n=1 Tax=Auriscalpium vulgare TaxID=40419 RepID=A0ACB8R423_9AGAM|nr:hypothetical protein FA95DRAFT_1613030 [Auriscalpium vulgare]